MPPLPSPGRRSVPPKTEELWADPVALVAEEESAFGNADLPPVPTVRSTPRIGPPARPMKRRRLGPAEKPCRRCFPPQSLAFFNSVHHGMVRHGR
jgi:hypothetical protein